MHSVKSRAAELITTAYVLSLAVAIGLDLITNGKGPWGFLVFLFTYPWSMLLLFFASWSLAHGRYPIDYYFALCGFPNMIGIFLLARLATKQARQIRHSK